MTNLITEARELCERATGGPWTGEENTGVQTATGKDVFQTGCGCCTSSHLSADDAAFIARSRTLIPELCDALEKAQAEIERLRGLLFERNVLLDKYEAEHRWIPVSERLPENGRCLTCSAWCGKQMININSFSTDRSKVDDYDMRGLGAGFYNYHSESGYFPVGNITHWMPLPAPPEEGAEK